jgi:protein-tyrosine kinase
MSRVHDALRRVETNFVANASRPAGDTPGSPHAAAGDGKAPDSSAPSVATLDLAGILERVQTVPLSLSPDASLIDVTHPNEAPMEEFRTLRTRLNHLQGLQPIHSLVVTSPSPAEGKSFTAANLAIVQSQLEGNFTLLADFDFRRPVVHNLFQVERSPGVTDYLQGKAKLEEVIKRVEGTNLFLLPAGEAVINPLELLNLPEGRQLFELLPSVFNWVILDTPPLLFAADANLLSTLCHGTIMVVRVGATTIDSVTRAIQSLCQNNILGIVVNGAQKSELYHKYTYYHSYYYSNSDPKAPPAEPAEAASDEDDEE